MNIATQILQAGSSEETLERLLQVLYEELRKLAECRMAVEPEGQTLQPTALVHEARQLLSSAMMWNAHLPYFEACG